MKYVVALLFCFASYAAQAAPPPSPSKVAKLHELMQLIHFDESIEREKSLCFQRFMTGMFTPDKVAQEKGSYRGFKPGTPEWPKVLAAYKAFSERSCSYYTVADFEQAYIEFFGSKMSEADLDAYLAFEKTPAAQHMVAAENEQQAYFSSVDKRLSEPVYKDASDQMTASLKAICDDESLIDKLSCHP